MRHNTFYTLGFATALCVVLAVLVSGAAVGLKEEQEINKQLDRQSKVLEAAGLVEAGAPVDAANVERLMASAEAVLVDLKTGQEVEGDALAFDQQKAKKDPSRSFDAPSNRSRIQRLPDRAVVYKFLGDDGALDTIVLPIEGYGLWGTLYGYLALEEDGDTVVGITYYDHKETPGLGGEVDNANWKSKWPGREVYDDSGEPALAVVKGSAPPPSEDPFKVDGLSGATLTSRGVTNMIDFWLGDEAFGPYLDRIRTERRAA